jgi:hypothetical protein
MLTEKEKRYCSDIADRMHQMRQFLNANVLVDPPEPTVWHSFLAMLRKIQGNLSNDGSFIATLLAKQYLHSRYGVIFDAAEKPQGAPGVDIDIYTPEGHHIVAEIKTTVPYQGTDFGSNQANTFKKDFAKLDAAEAEHKFLFVTDSNTFSILQKDKYTKLMPGVCIVDLITGEEHTA